MHRARIIHCDNTVPELYIEHAACTSLNQANVEVSVNLQTYVSPTDTTVFLNPKPLILDPDYIPDTIVAMAQANDTLDTTLIIGEYSTIKTEDEIKTEPEEIIKDILERHSPQCKLQVQISNIVSLNRGDESPVPTEGYSTESTTVARVSTPPAYALDASSSTIEGIPPTSASQLHQHEETIIITPVTD